MSNVFDNSCPDDEEAKFWKDAIQEANVHAEMPPMRLMAVADTLQKEADAIREELANTQDQSAKPTRKQLLITHMFAGPSPRKPRTPGPLEKKI